MKQVNQRDAEHYISTRQEFKASALMGTFAHIGVGRLDIEEHALYNEALALGVDYLVYSYGTPIAWHTPQGWYIVAQKFSVTTSKHQNAVRRAISSELVEAN